MLKLSKCAAQVQRQEVRPLSVLLATLQDALSQFISRAGRMSWQVGSFCLGQRISSLIAEREKLKTRRIAMTDERTMLAPNHWNAIENCRTSSKQSRYECRLVGKNGGQIAGQSASAGPKALQS
ncbi:hypothetical protein [Bradyrhizobium sp. B117]|uniref:hypothetical protein n=1 Tax=Bradyrhizobium sp. B117 TaxID=3140246 RepID=UPI003183C772